MNGCDRGVSSGKRESLFHRGICMQNNRYTMSSMCLLCVVVNIDDGQPDQIYT